MLGKYSYLAMLIFTFFGSFWLTFFYQIRILSSFKKVLLSILPFAALYLLWDIVAIKYKNWRFDKDLILGIILPFHIPVEEFLFFLIIPLAAILTLEAVLSQKPNWKI